MLTSSMPIRRFSVTSNQSVNRDYLPKIDVRTATVKPALRLDFDGTIRYARSGKRFIDGPDDVALFPGVENKLWSYRDDGYLIFGVTNQGGVAYEIKTPPEDMAVLDTTLALFARNPFHIVKVCWHHEDGTSPIFGHRSLFRKPDIGMLAMCEFEAFNAGFIVDWGNSLMVGDRPEDEECARRADIGFMWAKDFFEREEA
jgi:D-glycero-D-manno-heptose 1,7-bisphosphate phosphatase